MNLLARVTEVLRRVRHPGPHGEVEQLQRALRTRAG